MKGDASPFHFAGDGRGVLCIHGFTSSPFEMRYLGRELARSGMTVSAPLLPGHASTPEDLAHTGWRDWYAAVEGALDALLRECDDVAVVGQSLGGLLALRLGRERGDELSAVAALATPLWLTPLGKLAAAVTRRMPGLRSLPKTGIDIRDRAMKARIPTYSTIPATSLHSLVELAESVRGSLDAIEVPLLVLHSRRDHTAPYVCSEIIASQVSSEYVRHRAFEACYHLLSLDLERNIVAAEVAIFFEHHFRRGERDEIRRLD